MIDTTTEQVAALRAEVAALTQQLNHPALAELIAERDRRDAGLRELQRQRDAEAALRPTPLWTPDANTPPPETVSYEQVVRATHFALADVPGGEWSLPQSASLVLARCEDGSVAVEAARAALLTQWRLDWEQRRYRARDQEVAARVRGMLDADVAEQLAPQYAAQERQLAEANARGVPVQVERVEHVPPRPTAKARAAALVDTLTAEADALAQLGREAKRAWEKVLGNGSLAADNSEALLSRLCAAFGCIDTYERMPAPDQHRMRFLKEQADATIDELGCAPMPAIPGRRHR